MNSVLTLPSSLRSKPAVMVTMPVMATPLQTPASSPSVTSLSAASSSVSSSISSSASWKNISRMSSPAISVPVTPPPAVVASNPMIDNPFLPEPILTSSPKSASSQDKLASVQSAGGITNNATVATTVAVGISQPLVAQSIERICLRDSKQNLQFVPILSAAEATKQSELGLIIRVETMKTPDYVLDAVEAGYFFICYKSGKCVTVKDNFNLLVCRGTDNHELLTVVNSATNCKNATVCKNNNVCKYICFSAIRNTD